MVPLAVDYIARRRGQGDLTKDTAAHQLGVLMGFARAYGARPVSRLGATDIDRWRASTASQAPGTRRTKWATVRCFVRWLVQEGHVRRDPMVGMRPPKVPRSAPRALPFDQSSALYRGCVDERDRLIITLGLQLGLRRAELARLEVGDVDLVNETVDVRGKGGHVDRLPLTADARVAVRAYLMARGMVAGPLIRGDRDPNAGVSPDWVGVHWVQIAYRAGVKRAPRDGVGSHSARHTAASDTYERTKDPVAVKELLRHSSLAVTDIYLRRLNLDRLREAAEGRHYNGPRQGGDAA